jgi:uncharacterized protein YodC (DUF2158 family)
VHIDDEVNASWIAGLSKADCSEDVLILAGDVAHRLRLLQKFHDVSAVVKASGASMQPFDEGGVSIVPLFGWYDYSFAEPSEELQSMWMGFYACRWPSGFGVRQIAAHFVDLNPKRDMSAADKVITFSHFLPSSKQ